MNYPTHRRARVTRERHTKITPAVAPSVKTQAKIAAIDARLSKFGGDQ